MAEWPSGRGVSRLSRSQGSWRGHRGEAAGAGAAVLRGGSPGVLRAVAPWIPWNSVRWKAVGDIRGDLRGFNWWSMVIFFMGVTGNLFDGIWWSEESSIFWGARDVFDMRVIWRFDVSMVAGKFQGPFFRGPDYLTHLSVTGMIKIWLCLKIRYTPNLWSLTTN